MDEPDDDRTVTLELRRSEALVCFEWLQRLAEDDPPADGTPFAAAVRRLRWDLAATLESSLAAVVASGTDYEERLAAAVEEVRDDTTDEDGRR